MNYLDDFPDSRYEVLGDQSLISRYRPVALSAVSWHESHTGVPTNNFMSWLCVGRGERSFADSLSAQPKESVERRLILCVTGVSRVNSRLI